MKNKTEDNSIPIWMPLNLSVFAYFFALWIMKLEWDIDYLFYLVINHPGYLLGISIESLGYLGLIVFGFLHVLLSQIFIKSRRNKYWRRKVITNWASIYIVLLFFYYFNSYLYDKELFDNRWVCHEYDQSIQLTPRQKEIKSTRSACEYIYTLERNQGPRAGGHLIKHFYERSKGQ